MQKTGKIEVSVLMITYGHEKFIEQAIIGVLNQKCDFEFKLLIANDNSPDHTDTIIKSLIKTHPKGKLIDYIRHEKNMGMIKNFHWILQQAKGKYFALCEGDDYWIDVLKLQKQVDFFNNNNDYSMVFTPAMRHFQNVNKPRRIRNRYPEYNPNNFKLENILKLGGGFYPTCTSMFRKDILDIEDIDKFTTLHSTGDYPIAILAAIKGKIGYIDDITAVYRVQENSVSNMVFNSCENCTSVAKIKHKKNISYIKFLFKKNILSKSLKQELFSKENYILLSKHIDCRDFPNFIKNLIKFNLFPKHILRILLKITYVLFMGNTNVKIRKNE